jgi:hypothetical protein
MRTPTLVIVLTLAIGGVAYAQPERQAVPTDECTPGSMQVILGLCTASQREEAKRLNTDSAAPRAAKPKALPRPKAAAPPAAVHGGATISVHFSADEIAAIDAWIARQPDHEGMNRAEAVHKILSTSLPQVGPAP